MTRDVKASLRQRLYRQEMLSGAWVAMPSTIAIEALGTSQDFFVFDGEHGAITPDELHALLPVSENMGMPVVFRPRRTRDDLISAALDAGARALMLPMVDSASSAAMAVGASRYPPRGTRGFGPWRASDYYRQADAYASAVDDELVLIAQIEHPDALACVEDIAAVDGVDVLYVGPADLGIRLGGDAGAPGGPLEAAYASVARAAHRHGKLVGTDVIDIGQIGFLKGLGYTFFTFGSDAAFLSEGSERHASQIRAAFDKAPRQEPTRG